MRHRPANNQMEPTRRLSRAIMSLRRAAHLERYTDRERRTSNHFNRGSCSFLVFIAASCCFARRGQVARLGALGRFDLGRGIDEEQEHLAAATIGAITIMWASGCQAVGRARTAARRHTHCWPMSAQHSSTIWTAGSPSIVSTVGPDLIVSDSHDQSLTHRFCGFIVTATHSRAFVWRGLIRGAV
jgi:hypothetical protein